MSTMEVLCLCAINLLSFVVGARIGQMTSKQEKIEINPIKAIKVAKKEQEEIKTKEAEEEYFNAIYQNIDNYTGDSIGQIEIPRRK